MLIDAENRCLYSRAGEEDSCGSPKKDFVGMTAGDFLDCPSSARRAPSKSFSQQLAFHTNPILSGKSCSLLSRTGLRPSTSLRLPTGLRPDRVVDDRAVGRRGELDDHETWLRRPFDSVPIQNIGTSCPSGRRALRVTAVAFALRFSKSSALGERSTAEDQQSRFPSPS